MIDYDIHQMDKVNKNLDGIVFVVLLIMFCLIMICSKMDGINDSLQDIKSSIDLLRINQ